MILEPGENFAIRNYELRYVESVAIGWSDRTEFISTVEVYRDGEFLKEMRPKRTFSPCF